AHVRTAYVTVPRRRPVLEPRDGGDVPPSSGQPGAGRYRRITGRYGERRATSRKPCSAKTEAIPRNRLRVWPSTAVSTGYASSAGAPAEAAAWAAASISV